VYIYRGAVGVGVRSSVSVFSIVGSNRKGFL
jgi:hypothetical protein